MNNDLKQSIEQNFGKVTITHALQSKWFGTEWSCTGYDYNKLKWFDINSVSKPSEEELQIEVDNLQEEYDALAYSRQRQSSSGYPSVGDQLDMLMKDMKNGTTTHQEACEAVKLKYPKP